MAELSHDDFEIGETVLYRNPDFDGMVKATIIDKGTKNGYEIMSVTIPDEEYDRWGYMSQFEKLNRRQDATN